MHSVVCKMGAPRGLEYFNLIALTFIIILTGFKIQIADASIDFINEKTDEFILSIPHENVIFNKNKHLQNKVYVLEAEPGNACEEVKPPPNLHIDSASPKLRTAATPSFLLLSNSEDCDLDIKIRNAQQKGYDGLIIFSNSHYIKPMPTKHHLSDSYKINVYFISDIGGQALKNNFLFVKNKSKRFRIEFSETEPIQNPEPRSELSDLIYWIPSPIIFAYLSACKICCELWELFIFIGTADVFPGFLLYFVVSVKIYRMYRIDEPEDDDRNDRPNPGQINLNDLTLPESRKLLHVPDGATRAEISKAFRDIAPPYHPDRNGDKSPRERREKKEIYLLLNAAKKMLLDATPGTSYDD